MRKYIFVTGGAVSDSGKTTLAASIGLLLSSRGFKVVNKKLNPCINMSMADLNPSYSGEIFVSADGSESDLSLGFYERFTGEKQSRDSFATAGSIYWSVINKERMGTFMGEMATISNHVAEEIKNFVYSADADIVIVEVGGTVGDVESVHFLDAVGKVREEKGTENAMYVHIENIPKAVDSDDEKFAPINRAISVLLERGIQPDMMVCRTEGDLSNSLADKISIYCNLTKEAIVEWKRTGVYYEAPFSLEKGGLSACLLKKLSIQDFKPKLDLWKSFVLKAQRADKKIKIALVGKYASLRSAYQSLKEALECAAIKNGAEAQIEWIDPDGINERNLEDADAVVIPDGKGSKGIQGMMMALVFAREKDIPLLAIGQGMHVLVSEFASSQFEMGDNGMEAEPVVAEAKEQVGEKRIKILRGSKLFASHGKEHISERCRYKYAVNGVYKEKFEKAGLYFIAENEDGGECVAVELAGKHFYVGVQYNPEFSSTPVKVHPLFDEFIREIKKQK